MKCLKPGTSPCRLLFCVAILLSCAAALQAQDVRYLRHQSWSTEDGLPQNTVRQIYQTRDGYLWLATEGGLARFDGTSFQAFTHLTDPVFRNDDICCLREDADGVLWIGTDDGVLSYRDHSFRRFGVADGLPFSKIQELAQSPSGAVVVKTAKGVATWKTERFQPVSQTRSSTDQNTAIPGWLVSNRSVSRSLGGLSKTWTVGAELPGTRVLTLSLNREGGAWIGTNDGLSLIGSKAEFAVPVESLRGTSVVQLFEDREGNEWIGTEAHGLHVLRTAKFRTEPALAGMPLTSVVQTSDHAIWAGTERDGLRRVRNGRMDEPLQRGALTSGFILSLAPGEDGSVWVGTPDGLNHVSRTGKVQSITSADGMPDDYVLSLAASRDGSVWAGTRHGLVHLRGGHLDVRTRDDGLSGELIGTILSTSTGDLWMGTSDGISRLDSSGHITNFGVAQGLPKGILYGIAEGSAGTIWVVGDGFGLLRFQNEAFVRIQDPAIAGTNFGILADALGFLWLRNHEGIERIPIDAIERCHQNMCTTGARLFGTADGVPSLDPGAPAPSAFWKTADGELWSPTRRGAVIVNPSSLHLDLIPPPLVIKDMEVDGSPVVASGVPLEIAAGHVRFTVNYAALSYTTPSEVQYRFRLDGLDHDWSEPSNKRSAIYTSLGAGNYTFRVQAANPDGVWNLDGASLRFRIVPPYYRQWWFLFLLALALVAIAALIYRLRLRTLQQNFELVLAERNRIAREIHDTLAQDFVGVTLQLDLISQLLGTGNIDAIKLQLAQTRRLVTDGLADARESIWLLRASAGTATLPVNLTRLTESYANGPVDIRLKITGTVRRIGDAVEAEVLRIAQESLLNVSRHSHASFGWVTLAYGMDRLTLTVKDDGRGFAVAEAQDMAGHYGLRGMMERAQGLKATLDITSAPGTGTMITVIVPLR